jgi:hypothetical protein
VLIVIIEPRIKWLCLSEIRSGSVALPAWLMGHKPGLKIIVVSYSDELARKLSRDFRTVVERLGCDRSNLPKSSFHLTRWTEERANRVSWLHDRASPVRSGPAWLVSLDCEEGKTSLRCLYRKPHPIEGVSESSKLMG